MKKMATAPVAKNEVIHNAAKPGTIPMQPGVIEKQKLKRQFALKLYEPWANEKQKKNYYSVHTLYKNTILVAQTK